MLNHFQTAVTIFPTFSDFEALAREGNLIPVCTELTADCDTPVSVYHKLSGQAPAFLFESIVGGEHIGRYSFIGCRPRRILEAYPDRLQVTERDGTTQTLPPVDDPLQVLQSMMDCFRPVSLPGMPPFIGGAVGFLGYEYIHCVEPTVPVVGKDELNLPYLYYLITDTLVAFDHARQTMRLIVCAHLEDGQDARSVYDEACAALQSLYSQLTTPAPLKPVSLKNITVDTVPEGNFTREAFEEAVDQCKDYIRAGDVIQVVASQRFQKPYHQSPLDLYRALRVVNPSPYMFLFDTGRFATVGASPEVHVRLTGQRVESRPIAGTRPRGQDEAGDRALEIELLADAKERAEHLMLVDLARNDIGRVCQPGSVTVKDYAIVERYSHVMHIVSQVEGELSSDKNAYDLMRVTFPAGTVSGAPKVRAMQIIAELEPSQRGVYSGALGYFSYDGNLDCCIAIRTALIKDGVISIQAGAGLVADSVPPSEYQETINKAKGMLKAVALSEHMNAGGQNVP